ncbi:MAG: bifunctional phosphopantothenoylcysteine decarboxylase/phosphopantothenate--cysteine ligase CoaBC [Saprospiraceae bacterium]|nr:bifunctional phosphopantothenoylcysteine decarboxylase/phosphopantothenate--cysteine ligase CoaBC [Saprospiraceae bacterium]
MLKGKKIILAVTGSIAAYKSALLCRELIKAGCEVKVVMTDAAQHFVSALTMSTLSANTVYSDWENGKSWTNHVDLGLWADLMIIAPATANTIAKMAQGQCDNMLMATYLSAKCPVIFAPAMDRDMWIHSATQHNIRTLLSYGHRMIPVGYGFLASGLTGDGRMAEPAEIVQYVTDFYTESLALAGKKIMITAGPTYEAIDPVRFIGNYSSGKMGYELAQVCAEHGGEVVLISGPSKLTVTHSNIKLIRVISAQEMYQAADVVFDTSDFVIFAAAVADYRPEHVAPNKIKKKEDNFSISLVKNIDIAATLGKRKKENQLMVGFALETDNEISHAIQKLHKKNMDFIVLNSLNDPGAGFMHDTNKITIIDNKGNEVSYGLKNKRDVAGDIVDYILKFKK